MNADWVIDCMVNNLNQLMINDKNDDNCKIDKSDIELIAVMFYSYLKKARRAKCEFWFNGDEICPAVELKSKQFHFWKGDSIIVVYDKNNSYAQFYTCNANSDEKSNDRKDGKSEHDSMVLVGKNFQRTDNHWIDSKRFKDEKLLLNCDKYNYIFYINVSGGMYARKSIDMINLYCVTVNNSQL